MILKTLRISLIGHSLRVWKVKMTKKPLFLPKDAFLHNTLIMANLLQKIDELLLYPFYQQFINRIDRETSDCQSLLDIGCGFNLPIKRVTERMDRSVGLDVFQPSIDKAIKAQTHNEFVVADVKSYLEQLPDKSFDAVLALDLIEHLTKEQGFWLISQMERLARKKVVIFTPNGFVPQTPYDNNPWQAHISGWDCNEMSKMGYEVFGYGGYKKWRGERFAIRFKPRIFWKYLAFYSQIYFHRHPLHAYGILCIKKI